MVRAVFHAFIGDANGGANGPAGGGAVAAADSICRWLRPGGRASELSSRKKNGEKGGMAVVIVLVVVTLLTIYAGLFAYSMKIETRLALNSNNDEQMLWLGRGGVELASYVIALSGSNRLIPSTRSGRAVPEPALKPTAR